MTTAPTAQDGQEAGKPASPALSVAQRRASIALQGTMTPAAQRPALALKAGGLATVRGDDRDMDGSMMTLSILAVHTYERNPRHRLNPLYSQIKESIRLLGITQTISVTRRPGEDHYICFAGGNTRVTAQKELFSETGSPKYSEINVTFRAWRGEAAVLAAHLGENHTHGATSYWDDVRGLMELRDLVEAEQSIKLSGNDLHARAAALGIDFGLREVKYMVFAHEHLAPLGPRLTATSTKQLQPAHSGLQALASTFGLTAKVGEVLSEALSSYVLLDGHRHDAEAVDAEPTDLSVAEVIAALNEAFGLLIGVSGASVELMLAAKAANPRITAEELRNPRAAPARRLSKDMSPETAPVNPQMPLSGPAILAPVAPVTVPSGGRTLAPAGAHTRRSAETGEAPSSTLPDAAAAAMNVVELLKQITVVAELQDVVTVCPSMPLGFYLELPAAGIDSVDGNPPQDARLRRAAWQVLAGLSGQFDASLVPLLPTESDWRQLATGGGGDLGAKLDLQLLVKPHDGDVHVSVADLYCVLWHPQLGHLFAQLWTWAMYWRASDPERFPAPVLTNKLSVD